MEWLPVAPGSSTGVHRIDHSQVVLVGEGQWEVAVNRGNDAIIANPTEGSVVSIPASAWRNLKNVGAADALALLICGSDQRAGIQWDSEIVDTAEELGWGHDAAGYLAPLALLGRPPQ